MLRDGARWAFVVALVTIMSAANAADCPLQYSNSNARTGGLLMGGVLNNEVCRDASGQPCPRSGYW
jgi:hypothetical protein